MKKEKEPIYFVTPNPKVEKEIIKALGFTLGTPYKVIEKTTPINSTSVIAIQKSKLEIGFYNSGLFREVVRE